MSGDGTFIVVGDAGSNDNFGAARVYTRAGDGYDKGEDLERPRDITDFGYQVAISSDGTRIVVSDSGEGGVFESNVYVYTRRREAWGAPVKLDRPPYASAFGVSIAISRDGKTIAVGDDQGGRDRRGEVHVFHFDGVRWDRGTLIALSGVQTQRFGHTVALAPDASVMLVSDNTSLAGDAWRVHALRQASSGWTGHERIMLSGARAPLTDSIAIAESGSTVVIGNMVFEDKIQDGYGKTVKLSTPNESTGTSVAISADGKTVLWSNSLVGPGEVFMFRRVGDTWSEPIAIKPPGETRAFGTALTLTRDGTLFAVGDMHGLSPGTGVFNGAVTLYP